MPPSLPGPANIPGDGTRERILEAALELFGERGLHAASVRDVAKLAKANVAAISYHFGGKEELYRAVARHVAGLIGGRVGERAPEIFAAPPPADAEEARQRLETVMETLVDVLIGHDDMRRVARFVLREQMQPSPAFDILYGELIQRLHSTVCVNFAVATGEEAESQAVRLRVFLLFGQALFLRVGEAAVRRRLGIERYDAALLTEVKEMLKQHLNLIVAGVGAERAGSGGALTDRTGA
ncbi:CerR family C-terminal domain-containing protein [Afifella pfennigii]|uniref:CerR family C-terminal domain-containing protein n=1 Tax=Afifella pfennigii TaxID=209897 RepID=UPI00068992C0|nr:CerR family C-terminal domain-containing protein [Afifella pfennigii]